jgi:UDP-N-acetylglucosamine:LPS N-acetylglucosamine transferase
VVLRLEPEGGGAPTWTRLAVHTAPAVRRARAALVAQRSEIVLGLGGFTCLPAVLAARSLGLPVALFEINAVPGRATRLLAPLAQRVFHAWPPPAGNPRERWTGPPLSAAFCAGPPDEARTREARRAEGFRAGAPLLLVLGGSQGARALNQFVARHVDLFARRGISVLHQTGPGRLSEGAFEREGYRRVEYLRDVARALSAATLVLCRGGASSLAEIGALARPACVVPYPHHKDRHQERNALRLGAGVRIVPEGRLDESMARELARLCGPEGVFEREPMSQALAGVVPLDGAARMWRELVALAAENPKRASRRQ